MGAGLLFYLTMHKRLVKYCVREREKEIEKEREKYRESDQDRGERERFTRCQSIVFLCSFTALLVWKSKKKFFSEQKLNIVQSMIFKNILRAKLC